MSARGVIPASLAILLLGGCATTDDPREGGFFSGVAGINSGTYDRRIQDREQHLQAERDENYRLQDQSRRLEQEKADKQRVVLNERQKLSKLNRDVKSLESKVAGLSKQANVSAQQVQEAQRRTEELKQHIARQQRDIDALEGGGDGGDTDQKRRQLEAQRDALQKEYDALMDYTLKLAR